MVLFITAIQNQLLEELSSSRHSPQFIKTEGSLPWAQKPVEIPDPKVRSSERAHNAALYFSIRLDL